MTHARLHKPALQRKEEVARAKAQPPAVARSSRAARDPRFMRAVDHLQRTAWRQTPSGADAQLLQRAASSAGVNVSPLARTRVQCFSAVLDVQRLSYGGAGVPVSSPHDPAEKEAEAIAHQVATMPAEEGAEGGAEEGAPEYAPRAPAYSPIARAGSGPMHAPPALMNEISAASPLGRPLPTHVRRYMEPRFRADFRGVRVHTGEHAARLSNRLNAHAFTVGNQVFFGRDRFNPDTHAGRHLIAHELTHTIQQGGAAQERPAQRLADAAARVARAAAPANVSSSDQPHVQRLGIDTILDHLADLANNIPGYRMFTIVLGVNPINMSAVDRSAANILRAIVEFMPGGGLITQALDKYGVFDKVGGWIEGQLASLGLSGAALKASLMQFLDSLGWSDLLHPGQVWDRAKAIFTTPIDRIITFVKSLAVQVLKFVKDAILRPLAELASQTPAWDLLIAVLGRNPITGDPVPRTAETLIGGFMKLIGQDEIWDNIKKSGAIGKAYAWFQGALAGLMGFVNEIPGLFIQALQSLEIADIIVLPSAFIKVGRVFSGFFQRFVSWAGDTIWNLLEIIFSVVAPSVIVYVKKAAATFKTILKNPIGFVKNLIAAGKQGLQQFVSNFVSHLKAALIGWLTGALGGAGVYIPQALTLLEIGKFVLSMLGITWPKIREKIVKVIGETAMKAIETGVDIVIALVKGGPAAAWEIIKQKLSDLKDMVIQAVIGFVKDKIVSAAVTKLLSLLSPVGAFIQAIIGIYNTIMFFVERMKQIAAVAANVIDSIAAIASGAIGAAANKVEQTMAGLLVLVISFLARIAGLGKVSDAVVNFLKMVQGKVDQAIDTAIKFIVDKAKALLKKVFGKKDKKEGDEKARWDKGVAAVRAFMSQGSGDELPQGEYEQGLASIKATHKFTTLAVVWEGESVAVEAAMSPAERIRDDSRKKLVVKEWQSKSLPEDADSKRFDRSKSGNKRLFAFKGAAKTHVYNARAGVWQKIKDDEQIRLAEEAAREDLKADVPGMTSLVEESKSASAPGLDVAGIGTREGDTNERLFLGEVKGGFQKGKQYFAPKSFTAITSTLRKNVRTIQRTAPANIVKRINAALKSGSVTVVIFLVGQAVVSKNAWPKLEKRIRGRLGALIKAQFPAVDIKLVVANINIEWR